MSESGQPETLPPADGAPVSEMGWEHRPEALTSCLQRFRDRFGDMPLYITENGMAAPDCNRAEDGRIDDADRIEYLRDHIGAVLDAIEKGVDVRGYLVWTLLDNFEWAEGYRPRFGIVETDYETLERRPKASYDWFAELAAGRALTGPA